MTTVMERKKQFHNMVKNIKEVDPIIISSEEEIARTSPFRQKFHIEAKSGVLNDPNGFSYFDGKYHLFYQWTPLAFHEDPTIWHHGWYHLASTDLVHWQDLGPGMESDTKYDEYGTYSGSAIVVDDQLFIIYTGNTWIDTDTDQWNRLPYQLGAFMGKDNRIRKFSQPLLTDSPIGYTGHFRDPKIWKHGQDYYAVLGAQRDNKTGSAILIRSKNLLSWQVLGELASDMKKLGYMWECPDYFEIGNKGILLFSPQGLAPQGNFYNNIYETGYIIGDRLDYANLDFQHGDFNELDAGFDFYASQTMATPDGRRLLTAWFGISEISCPTEKYHYAGCLILPRELSVQNGQLIQQPVRELKSLRKEKHEIDCLVSQPILISTNVTEEINAQIDMSESNYFEMDIRANQNNEKNTKLIFDKTKQLVTLSRTKSGLLFAEKFGTKRSRQLSIKNKIHVQIFVDSSSVEIFINGGITVFSTRIFPDADQNNLIVHSHGGNTKLKASIWAI
ncbi:sucrose-6-phosphate hydrolase [Oenococcus oeni]|uniref:sucrose-6-phosphate hydrolase n=1 Tax=Oenococcus oeni TaxID=1247 RepID=UPI0010B9B495|nr:sucrose-6-phosphate hydrolase [Oenococcus oeni]SYW15670.1 Sucrose-6-phosphate hydrolase [Oenococcus oeni]